MLTIKFNLCIGIINIILLMLSIKINRSINNDTDIGIIYVHEIKRVTMLFYIIMGFVPFASVSTLLCLLINIGIYFGAKLGIFVFNKIKKHSSKVYNWLNETI